MNTTTEQAAKTIKMMECPRCCGKGHIPAFSGVWGGTCFKCCGKGQVAYKAHKPKKIEPMNEFAAKHAAIIETVDFSTMTYAQRYENHRRRHRDRPHPL